MHILWVVVLGRFPDGQVLLFSDSGEVLSYGTNRFFVDDWLIAHGPGVGGDIEDRRIGRAVGQRRYGRVDGIHASLNGLEATKRTESGGAVRVQLDRGSIRSIQHCWNQGLGTLGGEKTSRVFQAEAEDVQSDRFAGLLGVVFVRVPWGNRVDEIDDGL